MTECGECRKERLKGAFCRVISVVALIVALAVALVAAEFPMVLSVAEGASMSYICIEADSGKVLDESNADARKFPASTTKILTALVVLENMPLDLEFRVDDSAVGVEGSSIYLKRGEIVTVGDMLYGLMLRSGNDAAVALAVATAGSVERFAAMMNDRARRAGAKNSRFVNPHGLHDDGHHHGERPCRNHRRSLPQRRFPPHCVHIVRHRGQGRKHPCAVQQEQTAVAPGWRKRCKDGLYDKERQVPCGRSGQGRCATDIRSPGRHLRYVATFQTAAYRLREKRGQTEKAAQTRLFLCFDAGTATERRAQVRRASIRLIKMRTRVIMTQVTLFRRGQCVSTNSSPNAECARAEKPTNSLPRAG